MPLTLEDTALPAALFPGLLDRDLGGSLYSLMRDAYDRGPASADERLEPVAAGATRPRRSGSPRARR